MPRENQRDWEQNVLPCLREQGMESIPPDFAAVMELPGDEAMELHLTYAELSVEGLCD